MSALDAFFADPAFFTISDSESCSSITIVSDNAAGCFASYQSLSTLPSQDDSDGYDDEDDIDISHSFSRWESSPVAPIKQPLATASSVRPPRAPTRRSSTSPQNTETALSA